MMILSSVSETRAGEPASRAGGRDRRAAGRTARERLAGLTDTGKALLAAIVATELRRPMVVVVESGGRAEALAASMQFFYAALAGQEATEVAVLPAMDVFPWEDAAPHAEILENRAVTLWRYATGQARIVVAPVAAALMRLADASHYAEQARTLARDENVSLDELVSHLRRVGYESHDMVEMPGQFTVRGGIVDIFPAEAERPVRLELFGDSVESLREFDPNTQRSVRPIEHVTLPPLVEQPGFSYGPGNGNSSAAKNGAAAHSLFDLHEDTVILVDEPSAVDEASRAFFASAAESLEAKGSDLLEGLSSYYFTDEWDAQLARHSRLELEHLAMTREEFETRTIQTQPTTRFHGDVPGFMEEARKRVANGDRVLLAAESLGELERFADLCHEYEMPYRLAEVEENATRARLAEDSTAGSVPALLLAARRSTEGVVFLDARMTIYGTSTSSKPCRSGAKARAKTASFFSDFSELKPGDYVVHVDHGIGQFEGLHQIENGGARGEFMRLRYADDARLYVPLERLDLVQSYRAVEGAKPVLDKLGGSTWTARKARVKKSVAEMADKLLKLYAGRKLGEGFAFHPTARSSANLKTPSNLKKRPTRPSPSQMSSATWNARSPWIVCCAATWATERRKWPCAPRSRRSPIQASGCARPDHVLAFQHFETFRARFAAFPVRVELLSRFRTAQEQKTVAGRGRSGTSGYRHRHAPPAFQGRKVSRPRAC